MHSGVSLLVSLLVCEGGNHFRHFPLDERVARANVSAPSNGDGREPGIYARIFQLSSVGRAGDC